MVKSDRLQTKITELGQVCLVVRDHHKTMEAMWDNFGIGPWNITIFDADSLSDMTYLGQPARFGFITARLQNRQGWFEIELIEIK